MRSLLPRLHPITVALLTFILVICELFGGASDGEVSFAILPIVAGAAILGRIRQPLGAIKIAQNMLR